MLFSCAAVLSVVGVSLAISRIFRQPLELSVMPAISGITLLMLVSGLIGTLGLGRTAIVAFGLSYLLFHVVTQRPVWKRRGPGPVLLCLALAGLVLFNHNHQLVRWDEFSHWAQVLQYITATNQFPLAATSIQFPDYPFASSLFQYFVSSDAKEHTWLFAQNLWKLAAVLPLFSNLKWRHSAFLVVSLAALIWALPFVVPWEDGWDNLLIDVQLGLTAGAAVMIYLACGRSWQGAVLATPVIAVLPVLKEAGLVFAAIVVAIMLVDAILKGLEQRKLGLKETTAVALAVAVPILVKAAWQIHVRGLDAPPSQNLNFAEVLRRIQQPDFAQTAIPIIEKFWSQFAVDQMFGSSFTLLQLCAIAASLGLFAAPMAMSTWAGSRVIFGQALLAAGFIAYCALLLTTYLFVFSEYEGGILASYYRYMASYVVFWLLASIATALFEPMRKTASLISGFIAATVAAVLFWSSWSNERADLQTAVNPLVAARTSVTEALKGHPAMGPEEVVYSLWNGTNGMEHFVTAYELKPASLNQWCFSLGPKRDAADLWSCDISPEEFLAQFAERYTLLFLGREDAVFWEHYRTLFADSARTDAKWFALTHDGQFVPVN